MSPISAPQEGHKPPAGAARAPSQGKIAPVLPREMRQGLLQRLDEWRDGDVVAVQVGAHDGVMADPLRPWLSERGWSGLLIEPHPIYNDRLKKMYADRDDIRVVACGIGDTPGTLPLYHLSATAKRGYPPFVRGCASFDRDRMLAALNHPRARAVGGPDDLATTEVPVRRLDEVLDTENWPRMDVLVIDVEGFELQVLASFDIASRAPRLAIVECNGKNLPEEQNYIRALEKGGLSVFRAGDDLIGICEGFGGLSRQDLFAAFNLEADAS